MALAVILGFALVGVGVSTAAPARRAVAQVDEGFMYTAAFACVREVGPFDPAFMPGEYRTTVNVHNPQRHEVSFLKKAVIANSEETQERGIISDYREDVLRPDDALAIDCTTIISLLAQQPSVGNGFVVIESKEPLDVVAVYTQITEAGASVDVECIQPKQISGESVVPGRLGC
jgi:hypothetical protein